MIRKCQLCQNLATWHDLGKLEKGRLLLVCENHLPPEKERKKRQWTYSETGWTPVEYSSLSTKDLKKC